MLKNSPYKWPFISALILHIFVFSFLFTKFARHNQYIINHSIVNIVKAIAVDQAQVERNIARIQAEKRHKREAALTAKRKLEQTRLAKNQVKRLAKTRVLVAKKKQQKLKKDRVEEKRQLAIQQSIQQQISQENKQLEEDAKQTQGIVDKYKALIIQTISERWIVPDNLVEGISCQLLIHVAPGGDVLSVDLVRSSGNSTLDRSAKTAVWKASPLPVPKGKDLFDNFRVLRLTIRPEISNF